MLNLNSGINNRNESMKKIIITYVMSLLFSNTLKAERDFIEIISEDYARPVVDFQRKWVPIFHLDPLEEKLHIPENFLEDIQLPYAILEVQIHLWSFFSPHILKQLSSMVSEEKINQSVGYATFFQRLTLSSAIFFTYLWPTVDDWKNSKFKIENTLPFAITTGSLLFFHHYWQIARIGKQKK